MPIANDLRKTLTDPTPLYFAAGVVDKIREEAPQALAAVRETDPKEVQAKLTQQAKETQAKVSETLSGLDTDLKKLREQAQHLALQGVGVAAEYAVKARETYEELSVRGREAVKNWRGEGDETPEVTVEREPVQSVKIAEPPAEETSAADTGSKTAGTSTAAKSSTAGSGKTTGTAKSSSGNGTKSATAKKSSTARKTTGDTTTPSPRKSTPKTES
ncbi:hypothetical protein ACQEU8_34955 [Streptomyces sp. CA-250714]|uniref:hypothetical protein n=1 Tax=Streptomyces sp. CA-250714 TaxID=3240060 RepID=UPI003D8A02F4